jgi:hypothetical protein
MIRLALEIDPEARALRERFENEVEAPLTRGEEMIADARFHIYGSDTYPDATFTLRLTYGAVEGWEEKGDPVDPFTRTSRLFERTTGQRPFMLPDTWQAAREDLDPDSIRRQHSLDCRRLLVRPGHQPDRRGRHGNHARGVENSLRS